ncbi:MAG TPA: ribosome maturation factor RimM [Burkholderiales bacterium]|nr:ribosome maturation factor RimM [Burkholderiales bacterium]
MGRVAGAYGVRGWVKVAPDGGAQDVLTRVPQWWIGGQRYRVLEAKAHGATVLARLEGLATREQALELKGAPVAVRRDALPDPGEGHYYFADLVGLEVVNEEGETLGTIRRLFFNGAQDVMEVSEEGRKRLLPWVPAVVKAVDLQSGRVTVAWGADW